MLVFGMRESKVRKRLLRVKNLTLEKLMVYIIRKKLYVAANESRWKLLCWRAASTDVNALAKAAEKSKNARRRRHRSSHIPNSRGRECEYCGREYDTRKQEIAQRSGDFVTSAEGKITSRKSVPF